MRPEKSYHSKYFDPLAERRFDSDGVLAEQKNRHYAT